MSTSPISPVPAPCPYPGLRAFFIEETDWYFGREAHVDAMLDRLETQRFLAVVGSSGSGKSSLVFAGLIPALREGMLAGSRCGEEGLPAPWKIVVFHPGDDPLDNLTEAIVKAAANPEEPHLAGFIRAALNAGDGGLVEALRIAGLLAEDCETLLYADQFEELFRFSEKSTRAAQENALRFAKLFVTAAEQGDVRLHVLLSMRSEFIGECERYPGLPELVSRSQFLTPRLTRKQLQQSLACPAEAAGRVVAPDALTAILNDCASTPDQLPLAQHVLRRMWMRAAAEGRNELTLKDYNDEGGIRDSIAQHAEAILRGLPQPAGPEVARLLFMALCEQREDGPLVRRLSSRAEVAGIAGSQAALVAEVVAAFGGDDPGFVREDDGALDVRHEAILRQWPLINQWRIREAEAEECLHTLAEAAKDYDTDPETVELWRGNDLRMAEVWLENEAPSEAWARRHGVKNWDRCMNFLHLSHVAAINARAAEQKAARDKAQYRRRWTCFLVVTAVLFVILGILMTVLWNNATNDRANAVSAKIAALDSQQEAEEALEQALIAQDRAKKAEAAAEDARQQAQSSGQEATATLRQKDDIIAQHKTAIAELQKSLEEQRGALVLDWRPVALTQEEVLLNIQMTDPQQEESALALQASLLGAGFVAVNVQQPTSRPRPAPAAAFAVEAEKIIPQVQSVLAQTLKESDRKATVLAFQKGARATDRSSLTVWMPPVQTKTVDVIRKLAGTADQRAKAAAELVKIGQPVLEPLLAALAAAATADQSNMRLGVTMTLSKMPQPIFLKQSDVSTIVALLGAPEAEARMATADFLMDLWDGGSIRLVFAELKKLIGADPQPEIQGNLVYNAALVLGTWARTLNDTITVRPGDKMPMWKVALDEAKSWQSTLKASPKWEQWKGTIARLKELIERVEPPPFEIKLEDKSAKLLPRSSLAVYLCNFTENSPSLRIYVFKTTQPLPDKRADETEFLELTSKTERSELTLTPGAPKTFTLDGKTFTVTLKGAEGGMTREDHATLEFLRQPRR